MADNDQDNGYKPKYNHGHHLTPDFERTPSDGIVGVIMGSRSDWPHIAAACDTLEALKIPFEYGTVSAHRTPGRMVQYARLGADRGLRAVIAIAGGSAHLPGMCASETTLPVYGVAPKKDDIAALWSMVKMPQGVPLAYMGFERPGAVGAALHCTRWLAQDDLRLRERLTHYIRNMAADVPFTCFD